MPGDANRTEEQAEVEAGNFAADSSDNGSDGLVREATASSIPASPVDTQDATPSLRRLGQVPGFDGLRGIAVIIVLVAHMEVILPIPTLLVVPGGTVSLDSFFVLSGFLITTLLLREQSISGRVDKFAFYKRRALRLLPALVAVLIGQAIFAFLSGVAFHEEYTSVLSVLFYYSNWKLALNSTAFGGNIAPGLQHMWSLSFEEQFYLIWPWVTIVFLTVNRRLRQVIPILLALIAIVAVHRAFMYHGITTWYPDFVRTDTRADSILIGCLLAHIWVRRREPTRGVKLAAWIAAAFLLACLPLANLTGPFLYRGGLVLIDVACAILLLGILQGGWAGRRFFELKPLVIIGTVSYGLYLWHLPVYFAVKYYGQGWPDAVRVIVALGVTVALTILSWFLLERPALRWKARFERANRKQPTPVATS
jgi:peptidoglycan/LPS O-acetylase OafA/YrhL